MEYRPLGRTGVKVSPLCFGTMSFGGDADEAESERMFQKCRAAGINFFDCANVYNRGKSEEILGRLMKPERDELVITSKVFFPTGDGPNQRGLARRHIMQAVEASLRRLQTDRLDLYFCHSFDESTPMDETLRALDDLVHHGKILYPAVSNWAAWQISKALGISAREGLARFECIQPMYNLVKRQAEVEILPLAASEHMAVIPYSPLGGGLLTGKWAGPNQLAKDPGGKARLTTNAMYQKRYSEEQYWTTAERFSAYARAQAIDPATLAVAWVMHHPAVTAPIIGARNAGQLAASLRAAELPMTSETRYEISALTPAPPPATDRLEERKQ